VSCSSAFDFFLLLDLLRLRTCVVAHAPSFCFTALKDADQMLRALIGMVDKNGDGKIQYEGKLAGWAE
jgi:hypothetical protein